MGPFFWHFKVKTPPEYDRLASDGDLTERSGNLRKNGRSRLGVPSVVKLLIHKIEYEESNQRGHCNFTLRSSQTGFNHFLILGRKANLAS